jgi:hypothetical protein
MMAGAAAALVAAGAARAVGPREAPAAARATGDGAGAGVDLKVASDVRRGSLRFSGIDYGKSDRLGHAWLVLHYQETGPCDEGDIRCGIEDRPVEVKVPGLAYDAAAKQVVFQEAGAEPVVCAKVRHRGFPWYEDTFDATGSCAVHLVKVDRLVDDGFGGQRDRREEVHFAVQRR